MFYLTDFEFIDDIGNRKFISVSKELFYLIVNNFSLFFIIDKEFVSRSHCTITNYRCDILGRSVLLGYVYETIS